MYSKLHIKVYNLIRIDHHHYTFTHTTIKTVASPTKVSLSPFVIHSGLYPHPSRLLAFSRILCKWTHTDAVWVFWL